MSAAFSLAGKSRPSAMHLTATPSVRNPPAIRRGGHAASAVRANDATGSPRSASIRSTGMSFVKLQRPFAVISTFDPSRILRSKTRQPRPRWAATDAANIPAAPPPTTASGTGTP